jgi:hypothetical protein
MRTITRATEVKILICAVSITVHQDGSFGIQLSARQKTQYRLIRPHRQKLVPSMLRALTRVKFSPAAHYPKGSSCKAIHSGLRMGMC